MIKWCVIGAGGIADRRTIPALLEDSDNVLVALMEKNEQVGEAVSKKYGVKCYNDEEEMLKNEECDAVYIGTPVFCHYEQAMLALKYGKHVFIEKPIGDNGWINGGYFVCEPQIFDYLEDDSTIWERKPLETIASMGQLCAYQHGGFWHAMDTLKDKQELEKLWQEGKAPWKVWEDEHTRNL